MDASGTFLAISAVDPECDGRSRFEQDSLGELLEQGASIDLCGTGSIELYQYTLTNPPWRPFTRLPPIGDINSRGIMETRQQERDNTSVGLQVSLSGDGSVLTASGYDIERDVGFVKVFHVKELFYIDCSVRCPEDIGDGKCIPYEPYYTEECGYDGGDCPLPSLVKGLKDCKVAFPFEMGDGTCHEGSPINSKECNFDDGDCAYPSAVEGYPNCFVSYPQWIRNGICEDFLPYNSSECGFDGGDCNPPEFSPSSSPSESIQPSTIPSTSASPSTSLIPLPTTPIQHFKLSANIIPTRLIPITFRESIHLH